MTLISPHLYAQWCRRSSEPPGFHEDSSAPPERLLQAAWYHQRLLRDQLRTCTGQPVRILHPGFWNHEAGPDFRDAVVQFGAESPRTGDVEIDLVPGGWHAHAHAGNPAYDRVILHVIWEPASPDPDPLPVLALKPFLDAPLAELGRWLGSDAARTMPGFVRGQCGAPLTQLAPAAVAALLRQAALVRLEAKAAQCAASARQIGWEQALWDALFTALGYKQNVWPMRRIASLLPLLREGARPARLSVLALQARLLGVSGLLPDELSRTPAGPDAYLRQLWDEWWRERERWSEVLLPHCLWRFHGQRPANHPARRLALAAHWLHSSTLLEALEQWLTAPLTGRAVTQALLDLLAVRHDDHWSWHWTFRSPRLTRAQPLLGAARVTDLAMNAILPWFWARAHAGQNQALRQVAEARYLAWPAAADNAVLRLARQRLLGSAPRQHFKIAAEQQGLLQIVRDFCSRSDAICSECQFPELVRALPP